LWAIYIGPVLFDLIIPDLIKSFSSYFLAFVHEIIEYFFMIFFLIFILYPLFLLYRKLENSMKDKILSTPAKPGDLFLGEFLGQLPLIIIFILGIGPLALSLFIQINPSMTMLHYISFYLIFFSLIIFSLLIGTILANWLEHKFFTSKRAASLSNSFFLLLPFVVIILIYIFDFVFEIVNLNKELKPWMNLFPSFWYSSAILYLIEPSLIENYFLNIWIILFLIIAIPLIIAYVSYKKAGKFYDLEHPIKNELIRVKYEGRVSKIIKYLTFRKYRNLVITQFKEFIRKRENINRLLYIIAFNVFFGFFLLISLNEPLLSIEDYLVGNPPTSIPVSYFSHSVMIILSWTGGFTFGIFMGVYVFSNSKELASIYKRSIRGIKPLVFSFIYLMIYIILLNDIILTIFFTIIFQLDFLNAFTFFSTYMLNSFIIVVQAISIQCIKPLYREKGKFIYFNVYLIAILQIFAFFLALTILIPIAHYSMNYTTGLIYVFLLYIAISFGLAILLITIGIIKLNRI